MQQTSSQRGGKDQRRHCRTTTSQGITSMFLDYDFHVYPEAKAMKLLESCKKVFSTNDSVGNECTPETYAYRIMCMGMMKELAVTDSPRQSDKLDTQNAAIIRDHVGRSRPGYWVFVRPGSEGSWQCDKYDTENPQGKWNREAPQISEMHSASEHPMITATTIFEQGTRRKKEVETTFTSSRAKSPSARSANRSRRTTCVCSSPPWST